MKLVLEKNETFLTRECQCTKRWRQKPDEEQFLRARNGRFPLFALMRLCLTSKSVLISPHVLSSSRPGSRPNLRGKIGRFWKFVRAFSAQFAAKSTDRISKNGTWQLASRGVFQSINVLLLNIRGNYSCFREKV